MEGSHRRRTWIEVDLAAIRQNVSAFRRLLPQRTKIMAVVKADGYGHGAPRVARAALSAGADALAVATLDEGMQLRASGLEAPLLVLGYVDPVELGLAVRCRLALTVYSLEILTKLIGKLKTEPMVAPLKIHLKLDTGMGRIGLRDPGEVKEAVRLIKEEKALLLEGVFTHLACADEADPGYTRMQIAVFNQLLAEIPEGVIIHAANSAGALAHPFSYYDMVRIGISLYGIYPSDEVKRTIGLVPALSWKTRVIHLKEVPAGTGISYGATFRTSRFSRIATLSVGYADGYPRLLSNRGAVLIGGHRAPVVGRVCMDQLMVDVTDLPNRIQIGDEAVLIGCQGNDCVSVEELASKAQTIPYEILTGIGQRVPRIYPAGES